MTHAVRSALCALALAAAPAAFADDLSGDWLFETGVFDGNCKISGTFRFMSTRVPDTYTCVFTSEQVCEGSTAYVKVKQSCTAQRIGSRVAIKSKVAEIIEERPFADGLYFADNFIVSVTKKGAELVGGHYDEIRTATARFWRDLELLS
ncbi:hypothetical protein GC169_07330 [bacterium]|nr:hypothetical protein [bacterium]